MARHRWPGEDPIGKRITFDEGKHWIAIIGIAGDTTEYGPEPTNTGRIVRAYRSSRILG
jgi:hypothetical protein